MTTFARSTFDVGAYLKNRPVYSTAFIAHVLKYAKLPKQATALDLGCGPGQATGLLAASGQFKRVTGIDPSQGMVSAAQEDFKKRSTSQGDSHSGKCDVEYKVGSAEDLSSFEAESLDLVVAGQAAHWFNHSSVYPQLLRILKPKGTVAYWGYSYIYLPDYPEVSKRIVTLGQETLGDYWETGRKGPETLYDLVPFPNESGWDVSSFVRHKFDKTDKLGYQQSLQDLPAPPETRHFPPTMSKKMDETALADQIKTWSSVHTYMSKNEPEVNVVDSFMQEISPLLPKEDTFDVEWPIGLMLMRKL